MQYHSDNILPSLTGLAADPQKLVSMENLADWWSDIL